MYLTGIIVTNDSPKFKPSTILNSSLFLRASFLTSIASTRGLVMHICLGGVIFTLGVYDRGSHLCLGVIYTSDTGMHSHFHTAEFSVKGRRLFKNNCLGTVNCLRNIMQDMESLSLENKLLRIYDGIAVSDS